MISRIHVFDFVNWEGPPPVIVQEQGATFHRPGADGVGVQKIGRWADPFNVTLTRWDTSFSRALWTAQIITNTLPNSGPKRVRYEGIDMHAAPFRTTYLIDFVNVVSCERLVRQFNSSAGINYAGGGELIVELTMTPFANY